MALATKCPHCHTVFRVAADQLKLRGGIVRCGSCKEVFDGNAALQDPAARPPLPAAPAPMQAPVPLAPTPAPAQPVDVPLHPFFQAPYVARDLASDAAEAPPKTVEPPYSLDLNVASDPFGILLTPEQAELGHDDDLVFDLDLDVDLDADLDAEPQTEPARAPEPGIDSWPGPSAPPEHLAAPAAQHDLEPVMEQQQGAQLEHEPAFTLDPFPEPAPEPAFTLEPLPEPGPAPEPALTFTPDSLTDAEPVFTLEPLTEPEPEPVFTLGPVAHTPAAADASPAGSDAAVDDAANSPDGRREPTLAAPAGEPEEFIVALPLPDYDMAEPLPLAGKAAAIGAPVAEQSATDAAQSAQPGSEPAPLASEASCVEEPGFVKQGRRRQRIGKAMRILMGFGSLVLFIALLVQCVTTFRNQLAAQLPQVKPALEAACAALRCRIELPAQIEMVTIEQGELQALAEKTFSYTTALHNQSTSVQAWPSIELILNDANDKPVLRRVIGPTDYLATAAEVSKGFAPRSEQAVKLYFELKQLKASGYHIAVFYP